jgi:hypothetical protein
MKKEPLSKQLQTALIFAARYTHNRNTGATLHMTETLKNNWIQLSTHIQKQIIKESHEASTNLEKWQELREFEKNIK